MLALCADGDYDASGVRRKSVRDTRLSLGKCCCSKDWFEITSHHAEAMQTILGRPGEPKGRFQQTVALHLLPGSFPDVLVGKP